VIGRLNRSSNAPARDPARCAKCTSAEAVAALTPVRGSSVAVMRNEAACLRKSLAVRAADVCVRIVNTSRLVQTSGHVLRAAAVSVKSVSREWPKVALDAACGVSPAPWVSGRRAESVAAVVWVPKQITPFLHTLPSCTRPLASKGRGGCRVAAKRQPNVPKICDAHGGTGTALTIETEPLTARILSNGSHHMNALRLRHLLLDAAEHVPFYRQHWRAAGIDLTRIASAVHLEFLPVVRREDLLACAPEMRVDQRLLEQPTRINPSDDSSKQPFEMPIDHAALRRRRWRFVHALRDVGYVPGDKLMLISEPPFPVGASLLRWTYADLRRGEAEVFATYARTRPHVLYGPLSSLLALARRLLTTPEVKSRPKLVISTREELPDSERAVLESAFGARIADFYGTAELGLLAYTKPGISGYRMLTTDFHVETLRSGNAGMERLVITDLESGAMPLIRFDTGDLVRRDTARAGAPIVQLNGREAPRLVTAGYESPREVPLEFDGMNGLHAA
jgi:hypothetical protein